MIDILAGKTVLVAGAGGIGNGLATRYAAEGANVVLGDLEIETAQAAVDEIVKAGGQAVATVLDGADEASINDAVKLCVDRFGGIDGLHANFAYTADKDPNLGILELPLEIYDETMRVNTRGFYLCARAAIPFMIDRGGGSIIFTSSGAGVVGSPAIVAYSMSKAAGHALMRHIARRYGPQGIRANVIAPGMILHSRIDNLVSEATKDVARNSAAIKQRLGRPNDIAAMGALLLSDDGSYITGQVLCVDGGTTMRP